MKPFISVVPSEEFVGIAFMLGYWAEHIIGISLHLGWLEIAVGIILGRGEEDEADYRKE